MPYNLKNISGFPMDVSTPSGPTILPAYGELKGVDLGALDAEVMRQSPYVELTEGEEPKAKAPAKKKSAKAAPDPAVARLRGEYTDLAGKKPFAGWKAERLQVEIDKLLAK